MAVSGWPWGCASCSWCHHCMSPPLHWFCCHNLSSWPSCGCPKCCFGHVGAALGLLDCAPQDTASVPAVPAAVWPQRMNPVGGEGWASLCSILTYGKLHLEVQRGLGTASFAVPHCDFASCCRHLSAWWDLFQHLHPYSIFLFLCFCFATLFPLQGASLVCSGWVCEP